MSAFVLKEDKMERNNWKAVAVLVGEFIFLMVLLHGFGCGEVTSPFGAVNALGDKVAGDMDWTDLPGDAISTDTWQPGNTDDLAFKLPGDWQVETQSFGSETLATERIILKDTDKSVVTGAFAPEDYYDETQDVGVLNAARYAEAYTAVTITVYDDSMNRSWREFFNLAEPDVVAEFEPVTLSSHPDLESVRVSRVSGAFLGDARIFVRTGGKICDIVLDYRNRDRETALKIFNAFLANFNR
jgi:hypothetical protein